MFAKNFGVIVHHIADTGFLVALRDKDPRVRREARKLFGRIGKPLFVCEPVLTEAAHLVSPLLIARMVADGDLLIRFSVQEQRSAEFENCWKNIQPGWIWPTLALCE